MLLGTSRHELGGSEYLKVTQRLVAGVPPDVDLRAEKALQQLLVAVAREGSIRSAHDCAEGGLAVTLAECAFSTGGIGLNVDVFRKSLRLTRGCPPPRCSPNQLRESSSRLRASSSTRCLSRANAIGVPAAEIGTTGSGRISVSINGRSAIDIAVSEAESIWESALEEYFKQRAA